MPRFNPDGLGIAGDRWTVSRHRDQVAPSIGRGPIFIVSADDRLEYRTEAISAGCSSYITKPVDLDALLKTLNLLLQQGEGN